MPADLLHDDNDIEVQNGDHNSATQPSAARARESFWWWGNSSLGQLSEDEIVPESDPTTTRINGLLTEPLLIAQGQQHGLVVEEAPGGDGLVDRNQDEEDHPLLGERLLQLSLDMSNEI